MQINWDSWDSPHWVVSILLSLFAGAVASFIISWFFAHRGSKALDKLQEIVEHESRRTNEVQVELSEATAEVRRLQLLQMRAQEGGEGSYPFNRDEDGNLIGISHNMTASFAAGASLTAKGFLTKAGGTQDEP